MEITSVNQYHLRHEMSDSFRPAWKPRFEQTEHEVLLFELETDKGISGVATASGFAGRMEYLDLAELFLVGEDPREIESLCDRLDPLNLWGPRPCGTFCSRSRFVQRTGRYTRQRDRDSASTSTGTSCTSCRSPDRQREPRAGSSMQRHSVNSTSSDSLISGSLR